MGLSLLSYPDKYWSASLKNFAKKNYYILLVLYVFFISFHSYCLSILSIVNCWFMLIEFSYQVAGFFYLIFNDYLFHNSFFLLIQSSSFPYYHYRRIISSLCIKILPLAYFPIMINYQVYVCSSVSNTWLGSIAQDHSGKVNLFSRYSDPSNHLLSPFSLQLGTSNSKSSSRLCASSGP